MLRLVAGMGNRFSTLDQYHTIILAHGVLAAIVFLGIIPLSVMLRRFYITPYTTTRHSQLNIFAGLLLLVVFILGNLAVGPERSLTNPHHGIGVAIFLLFILQLLGGTLVRSIKKWRSFRRVLHQWGGRTIGLLGIVQVALGITLYGSPKYLFVLYAVWMAFLVIVYFILSYRHDIVEPSRGRTTGSEYFAADHKSEDGNKWKWLGPLAAGAGLWAFMRKRGSKSRGRSGSRSRSRSHRPEVISSRRGSASYVDEKYSNVASKRQDKGGGMMRLVGGAAAALGAGKLVSSWMDKRERRRDEDYSAVSTETPRRHRTGRLAPTASEFSSNITRDYPIDGTETSLLPPSAPPVMAGGMAASHRPTTPRAAHGRHRSTVGIEDSEYSSYVSPSRRQPDDRQGGGGGLMKSIAAGLGMGWFARKMADRRARRDEDRLRDEEDLRSGVHGSHYTGDGFPSPTRRSSRRPSVRRPAGVESELTESSYDSRPTTVGPYAAPVPATQFGTLPGGVPPPPMHGHSRSQSRQDFQHASMPSMPADPHGLLHSEAEESYRSGSMQRRSSSRRRRAGDRAAQAAAARAGGLATTDRDRYGSPHSGPVSVKLKVHDDKDRNVTLRRLTEEEARAARGPGGRGRADSASSLSELESPSQGRSYRREVSQQRRAELAAETRAEDKLAPLSPPNPAFAKGRRAKDSAYYSGQPGPSGTSPAAGQTMSSLGSMASPDSHGTWSAISPSPSGPAKDAGSAADNRRRRRLERRRGSGSRPAGADMYD